MDMENERFAAPRAHDGKGGIACIKNIQGALLRIVQLGFAQKRTYQCSAKTRRIGLGVFLPHMAIRFWSDKAGCIFALGFVFFSGNQARNEFLVFAQARFKRAAGRKGLERRDNRLDRTAPTPAVYLQLEHRVERASAAQQP